MTPVKRETLIKLFDRIKNAKLERNAYRFSEGQGKFKRDLITSYGGYALDSHGIPPINDDNPKGNHRWYAFKEEAAKDSAITQMTWDLAQKGDYIVPVSGKPSQQKTENDSLAITGNNNTVISGNNNINSKGVAVQSNQNGAPKKSIFYKIIDWVFGLFIKSD